MREIHRKEGAKTQDAILNLFDYNIGRCKEGECGLL